MRVGRAEVTASRKFTMRSEAMYAGYHLPEEEEMLGEGDLSRVRAV